MLLLYLALTVRLVMSGSTDICCSPEQYECQEGLLTGSVDDESHSAATFVSIGGYHSFSFHSYFHSQHDATLPNRSRLTSLVYSDVQMNSTA